MSLGQLESSVLSDTGRLNISPDYPPRTCLPDILHHFATFITSKVTWATTRQCSLSLGCLAWAWLPPRTFTQLNLSYCFPGNVFHSEELEWITLRDISLQSDREMEIFVDRPP